MSAGLANRLRAARIALWIAIAGAASRLSRWALERAEAIEAAGGRNASSGGPADA